MEALFPQLPTTSVVLVSYYTGPTLFSAIAAVLDQSAPVELIVVDNGNPPEVLTKLQTLAGSDARIKLLSGHGNVGFAAANSMGVAASQGSYLLILNPDCIIRRDTLQKVFAHLPSVTSPFMLGARIINEDGSDQRGSRRELLTPVSALIEALAPLRLLFPRLRLNKHRDIVPEVLASIPAISGAFMFIPRGDFERVQGFDDGYFLHVEDLDLCWRFRQAGGSIYFMPDVPVTHVGSTSEATSDFIERHKAKGFSRYFRKNFGATTPALALWCLDLAIWMRYLVKRLLKLGRPKRKLPP